MKQEGNILYAENKKVLYIEKLNKICKQYTCGSVMLPIEGALQRVTVNPEDIIECYIVPIDGVDYKIQGNTYGELVTNLIRTKYSLDDELALVANSRLEYFDLNKEKKFQDWRQTCKEIAKELMNE